MVYLGGDTRKQESETGKEEKLRPGWAAEVAAVSGGLFPLGSQKKPRESCSELSTRKKWKALPTCF